MRASRADIVRFQKSSSADPYLPPVVFVTEVLGEYSTIPVRPAKAIDAPMMDSYFAPRAPWRFLHPAAHPLRQSQRRVGTHVGKLDMSFYAPNR